MMVPAGGGRDLDKAHARLHEFSCQETLAAESIRDLAGPDPVGRLGRLGFTAEIEEFRKFTLHAKRQFKRFDRPFDLGMKDVSLEFHGIQIANEIELRTLPGRGQFLIRNVLERRAGLLINFQKRRVEPRNLVCSDFGGLKD